MSRADLFRSTLEALSRLDDEQLAALIDLAGLGELGFCDCSCCDPDNCPHPMACILRWLQEPYRKG